ncbi:hypothetical protein IQ264_25815 [Phormidium sp. LEGE 05292]|uniref:hypothetical protein n=1 Tax=[Phormidium] sp. LEGE 05292 TaxID=767427 RepID=UPI0018801612|nr:hypothetical protein [Phormidium sp. LEGE 05292]MBE9228833.1 hypothetical protein [Phormidium sp. LEGE 05292]
MILEQIDQLLADWKIRLDRASQNILALQELVTYQRLAGEAGLSKAKLTGTTATQVAWALDAIAQVFVHLDLLLATINQAATLRKQVPRFLGSSEKLRPIEDLLTGRSIQLSVVQVPLAQRSLLSPTESIYSVTPDELLAMMSSTFETARDTILAVDRAWSSLEPKLAQAVAEIQTLQQQAKTLRVDDLIDLKAAQQTLAPLRDRVAEDPLGVSDEFEQQIQPLIERAKNSLNQIWQQYNQVQDGLRSANTLLLQLADLKQQAEMAYNESLEKVTDRSGLQSPLPNDQLEAMRQWLSRLETRFAEGLISPIQVGLENWMVKVKSAIANEQQAVTKNNYPLETRRELRGRLEALKAKALARQKAEDPILSDLAAQAKQILYNRPTDLAKAIEIIKKYEKELNSY